MVSPTDQDLYVLQNQYGYVKIGRSVDVASRMAAIASVDRCRVEFVFGFRNAGEDEEAVHDALADHWVGGEWFRGSPEALAAIEAELSPDERVSWPFEWDEAGGRLWLERVYVLQDGRSLVKLYDRWLRKLDRCTGSRIDDGSAFFCLALSETGETPFIQWRRIPKTQRWDDLSKLPGEDGAAYPVPPFTTDLAAAMTLWPEEERPTSWSGSIPDCVRAALKARRPRLLALAKRRREAALAVIGEKADASA